MKNFNKMDKPVLVEYLISSEKKIRSLKETIKNRGVLINEINYKVEFLRTILDEASQTYKSKIDRMYRLLQKVVKVLFKRPFKRSREAI